MHKIDIVLTRPHKWKPGSWLIMKATNKPFSHAAMIWHSDSIGISMAYQATIGGVQFWSEKKFKENNLVIKTYCIEVSDSLKSEIIKEAVTLSGGNYGYLSVLGLGIVDLVEAISERLTGYKLKLKSPWGDGRKTSFCSELLGYVVLQKAFVGHINDGALDNLRTDDLDHLLQRLCLIYPERIKLA